MSLEFGTDAWIKAAMTALNDSPSYAAAAKNWEGDFYFVIDAGNGVPEPIYLYMDLWHGECRDAFHVSDPSTKSPTFELSAPIKIWQGVLSKKIDPIQGLMTRKLKLKGPMMKVMKAPKAAIELVNACASLDTTWP